MTALNTWKVESSIFFKSLFLLNCVTAITIACAGCTFINALQRILCYIYTLLRPESFLRVSMLGLYRFPYINATNDDAEARDKISIWDGIE